MITDGAGANPEAQVTFVDESYMAVASSELNVEHNLPQELIVASLR